MEARSQARRVLGSSQGTVHRPEGLPDPFESPFASIQEYHSGASHRSRSIRARWFQLVAHTEEREGHRMKLDKEIAALTTRTQARQRNLQERRALLDDAWRLLDGAESSTSRTFVSSIAQAKAISSEIDSLKQQNLKISAQLARTRLIRQRQVLTLFSLRPPSQSASFPTPSGYAGHANTRAIGPSAVSSKQSLSTDGRSDAAAPIPVEQEWTLLAGDHRVVLPLPTPSDIRRFPRKDINAAAALTAQILQINADICDVALPFSVGVDRDGKWALKPDSMWALGINETKHTLHLSQRAYETMNAPVLSRSNNAGSGTSSTFNRTSIEQSVLSLGASTLATLESFVQLPGRNHASWGRASAIQPENAEGQSDNETQKRLSAATDAPTLAGTDTQTKDRKEDPSVVSARAFCRSLTMLAFDAAYLAWTQGATVDLVSAGNSTLRLIYKACEPSTKGHRSHGALHPSSDALGDFAFPVLDFSKLLQLHETSSSMLGNKPASASTPAKMKSAALRSDSAQTPRQTSSKPGPASGSPSAARDSALDLQLSRLDESYVDAGQAAASILLSTSAQAQTHHRPDNTAKSAAPRDRQAALGRHVSRPHDVSGTVGRGPSGTLHGLDFLRRRGERVAQAARAVDNSDSPEGAAAVGNDGLPAATTSTKAGSGIGPASVVQAPSAEGGGVFLNGKEIGSTDTDVVDSSEDERLRSTRRSRRTSSSRKSAKERQKHIMEGMEEDPDEWDVL
ncbi:unnamed protein product [Parajaminaea phylloscopi]